MIRLLLLAAFILFVFILLFLPPLVICYAFYQRLQFIKRYEEKPHERNPRDDCSSSILPL